MAEGESFVMSGIAWMMDKVEKKMANAKVGTVKKVFILMIIDA